LRPRRVISGHVVLGEGAVRPYFLYNPVSLLPRPPGSWEDVISDMILQTRYQKTHLLMKRNIFKEFKEIVLHKIFKLP